MVNTSLRDSPTVQAALSIHLYQITFDTPSPVEMKEQTAAYLRLLKGQVGLQTAK